MNQKERSEIELKMDGSGQTVAITVVERRSFQFSSRWRLFTRPQKYDFYFEFNRDPQSSTALRDHGMV
jgi:hypothetical protein